MNTPRCILGLVLVVVSGCANHSTTVVEEHRVAVGRILVDCEPVATVLVNGQEWGTTPMYVGVFKTRRVIEETRPREKVSQVTSILGAVSGVCPLLLPAYGVGLIIDGPYVRSDTVRREEWGDEPLVVELRREGFMPQRLEVCADAPVQRWYPKLMKAPQPGNSEWLAARTPDLSAGVR
jgi:hypothetical protein